MLADTFIMVCPGGLERGYHSKLCHLTAPVAAMMRADVLVWLAALPMALARPVYEVSPVDVTNAFYRCQTDAAVVQINSVYACWSDKRGQAEWPVVWDDNADRWFQPTSACLVQAARAGSTAIWACRDAFEESKAQIIESTDAPWDTWDDRGGDWY